MGDQLIRNLLQRLGEVKTVLKKSYGNNPYLENRSNLIGLLSDHPVYVRQIEIWSNRFLAEHAPFDSQQAYEWEYNNREKVGDLRNEIRDFLGEFTFNAVYRSDIEHFTYNSVICPLRNEVLDKENIPTLIVIETDNDREVNAHLISPGSRYVQIFDWTTLKDIQDNWKEIKKNTKESNLEVEIGSRFSRLLWQWKMKGLSPKEISSEVNRNHKELLPDGDVLGADKVGVYLYRYEERLKKLRSLQ